MAVGAAFVNQLVIASRFGATSHVDAYLASFNVVVVLPAVVGLLLQTSVTPAFISARSKRAGSEWELAWTAIVVTAVVLALSACLMFVLARQLLNWSAPGLSDSGRNEAVFLLEMQLPLVVLQGVSQLMWGLLNALRLFALPAASQSLAAICGTLGIVWFGTAHGIVALALGWVVGMSLQTGLLAFVLIRSGLPLRPAVRLRTDATTHLWSLSWPYSVVAIAAPALVLIDQHFASTIGPGAIASMSFADKVFRLSLVLFIGSIYTSLYPFFAEAASARNDRAFAELFRQGSTVALAILLPVGLAISLLCEPIVQIIYARGAFSGLAVSRTSLVLFFLGFHIPVLGLWYLHDRALNALNRTRVLMFAAAGLLIAKCALAVLLVPKFGLAGLAFTTPLVFGLAVIGMQVALKTTIRSHPLIDQGSIARIVGAAGIMFLVIVGVDSQLRNLPPISRVSLVCVTGSAAFIVAAVILKVEMVTRPLRTWRQQTIGSLGRRHR